MMNLATDWPIHVAAFAQHLRATGAPPTTIELRTRHLLYAGRQLGKNVADVGFDDLIRWFAAQEWQPNTRRSYRSSIRGFYTWAVLTKVVDTSPAVDLPKVPVPRSLPRPTPEDAFEEALENAPPRLVPALLLAGQCGLRRGELARVWPERDLIEDLLGWSLRVIGKGGHVRIVPLPDRLARILRQAPPGWLFPSPRGGHLTPHYLSKLVTALLPGAFTTHTLRHRCGTVSFERTGDIRAVQELLGHARLDTTMLYTAVSSAKVRQAVMAAAA